MYEDFFGFSDQPFSVLPDPAFLYLSNRHRSALSALEYGLAGQAGFTVITGEVGCGKTTLLKKFLEEVDDESTVGLISNTHHSLGNFLQWIFLAFDLDFTEQSKVQLFKTFTDFVISEYAAGRRCVLIIDEAQNLTPDTLEELRMLSNINSGGDLLFQVVLTGQPELLGTLNRPDLRQFAQRITVSYKLEPLTGEETHAYIEHRLRAASGNQQVFPPEARDAVYALSNGVPRLINSLCDMALVYAFGEGHSQVSSETVLTVARDRLASGLGTGIKAPTDGDVAQIISQMGEGRKKELGSLQEPHGQQRASVALPVCQKQRQGPQELTSNLDRPDSGTKKKRVVQSTGQEARNRKKAIATPRGSTVLDQTDYSQRLCSDFDFGKIHSMAGEEPSLRSPHANISALRPSKSKFSGPDLTANHIAIAEQHNGQTASLASAASHPPPKRETHGNPRGQARSKKTQKPKKSLNKYRTLSVLVLIVGFIGCAYYFKLGWKEVNSFFGSIGAVDFAGRMSEELRLPKLDQIGLADTEPPSSQQTTLDMAGLSQQLVSDNSENLVESNKSHLLIGRSAEKNVINVEQNISTKNGEVLSGENSLSAPRNAESGDLNNDVVLAKPDDPPWLAIHFPRKIPSVGPDQTEKTLLDPDQGMQASALAEVSIKAPLKMNSKPQPSPLPSGLLSKSENSLSSRRFRTVASNIDQSRLEPDGKITQNDAATPMSKNSDDVEENYIAQLSVAGTHEAAIAQANELLKDYPSVFAKNALFVEATKDNGDNFDFAVVSGKFSTEAEAEKQCAALIIEGISCTIR